MKNNLSTTQYDVGIAQLFDNFAADLPQQPQLAAKAVKLCASTYRQNSVANTSRSGRFSFVRIFTIVAACMVVLSVVLSLSVFILGNGTNTQQGAEQTVATYAETDVGGKVLASADVLQPYVTSIDKQYNVTYERYYAYHFKNNGDLAYIHALLGVETDYGIVEIDLIAENGDYVLQSRVQQYNRNIKNSTELQIYGSDKYNGEYVTQAFFRANSLNFYVTAQSNTSNITETEKIIFAFYDL